MTDLGATATQSLVEQIHRALWNCEWSLSCDCVEAHRPCMYHDAKDALSELDRRANAYRAALTALAEAVDDEWYEDLRTKTLKALDAAQDLLQNSATAEATSKTGLEGEPRAGTTSGLEAPPRRAAAHTDGTPSPSEDS